MKNALLVMSFKIGSIWFMRSVLGWGAITSILIVMAATIVINKMMVG